MFKMIYNTFNAVLCCCVQESEMDVALHLAQFRFCSNAVWKYTVCSSDMNLDLRSTGSFSSLNTVLLQK